MDLSLKVPTVTRLTSLLLSIVLITLFCSSFSYATRPVETEVKKIQSLIKGHVPVFNRLSKSWGLEIRRLPDGTVIFSKNAHCLFITASLTKLFTSFAALELLGPNHFFDAGLRSSIPIKGILSGTLTVTSNGYPLWLSSELQECVRRFVSDFRIEKFQGSITTYQGLFFPHVEHICLDGKCSRAYNPVISPTAVDFNSIEFQLLPGGKIGKPGIVRYSPAHVRFRIVNKTITVKRARKNWLSVQWKKQNGTYHAIVTGKIGLKRKKAISLRVSCPFPDMLLTSNVEMAMKEAGVKIIIKKPTNKKEPLYFPCATRNLAEILPGLNRYSNNFMAEMLFRHLGGVRFGFPGSKKKGALAIQEVLRRNGIAPGEVHITCGSGLDRSNKATPAALGKLLFRVYSDPTISPLLLGSMARNGDEGTLRRFLKGANFIVMAKTGTLSDVLGMAGYIFVPNRGCVASFTVMCNDVHNKWKLKALLEKLLRDLAHLLATSRKPEKAPKKLRYKAHDWWKKQAGQESNCYNREAQKRNFYHENSTHAEKRPGRKIRNQRAYVRPGFEKRHHYWKLNEWTAGSDYAKQRTNKKTFPAASTADVFDDEVSGHDSFYQSGQK